MSSFASLPLPDDAQLAASHRLSRRIAEAVQANGGWLGFDAFMGRALYEPGLGYYSGGSSKFGEAGDFVTAPLISPLFGRCLAAQLAQWFEQGAPQVVYEFGAGTGVLAATLLAELATIGFPAVRYRIVELSGELRARQHATLLAEAPACAERVAWLDALPAQIDGVVLGNELLDAMPVRVFALSGGQVRERGVVLAPGDTTRAVPGFSWAERPADPAFDTAVRHALAAAGWSDQGGWPDGYRSELAEQAGAWLREVGSRLGRGVILLIDYGFPAAEFYHPQRERGTLVCHYRHRTHDDPLWLPGLQDITAHVDFSAADDAARSVGLAPLGYASQASFLLGCGLAELALATSPADTAEWARQAAGIQKLVSEAEMGELFKAIAWTRGLPDAAAGFARGDRRAALRPT